MDIKAVTNTMALWSNKSSIVPNAPMFYFKNVGNTDMWVDEILIKPGEKFGVDHSLFLATFWAAGKHSTQVIENTTYKIKFGDVVVDDSASALPVSGAPVATPVKAGLLVTTRYMISKQ